MGRFFVLYVQYVLAPTLSVGDVVFLDILSSHKVVGCLILFLSGVRLFGFCLCIRLFLILLSFVWSR